MADLSDEWILKNEHDVKLFRSEPPSDKDVKSLFIGRKLELRKSLVHLRFNLDNRQNSGKKQDDHFFGQDRAKYPWIVHGPTRSGKSHLARRIMEEFEENHRQWKLIIRCRERYEPEEILKDLFVRICELFQMAICPDGQCLYRSGSYHDQLVESVQELIESLAPFLGGHPSDKAEWHISQEHIESLQGEFKTGLPAIIQFSLRAGKQSGDKRGRTVSFSAPSAKQYGDYCGLIIDTLLRLDLLDHVFILVDDADLLENEFKASQSARMNTAQLADALVILHQYRGVDVLITARSCYAKSKKEFYDLIDLSGYLMETDDFVKIYHAHIQRFGWENKKGFLTDYVLKKAGEWAGKLPGVFLGHLAIALEAFKKEVGWEERDIEWYRNLFKNYYESNKNEYGLAGELLEDAVNERKVQISFAREAANPFFGTIYDNIFVVPNYYSDATCKVMPIAYEIW